MGAAICPLCTQPVVKVLESTVFRAWLHQAPEYVSVDDKPVLAIDRWVHTLPKEKPRA